MEFVIMGGARSLLRVFSGILFRDLWKVLSANMAAASVVVVFMAKPADTEEPIPGHRSNILNTRCAARFNAPFHTKSDTTFHKFPQPIRLGSTSDISQGMQLRMVPPVWGELVAVKSCLSFKAEGLICTISGLIWAPE